MSPGGRIAVSSQAQISLDALAQFATQLRAQGALARSGLEGK